MKRGYRRWKGTFSRKALSKSHSKINKKRNKTDLRSRVLRRHFSLERKLNQFQPDLGKLR